MKVLHIVPLSRRAGLQVMFINYLKHLIKSEPGSIKNHIVFAINHSGNLINEIENLGITVYKGNRKNKYDFSVLFQINTLIKKYNIDIIYGQNSTGNMWAYFAKILNPRRKLICHEHGTSWKVTGLVKYISFLWGRKSNKIIANSNAAKTILIKRLKIDPDKIQVVYNGIPESPYQKQVKKESRQLLFVGRLDNVKSPKTLIDTITILKKNIPNIKLVILGEGPLKKELVNLSKDLAVENNIIFKGSVSHKTVNYYMSESSILLLPSIREALGNVIIEAAIQKTATIASKVDGVAEVIDHNRNGILIKPDIEINSINIPKYVVDPDTNVLVRPKRIDPKKLAIEIENLLKDNKFKYLGEKAHEEIPEKFSINKYYKSINNILFE